MKKYNINKNSNKQQSSLLKKFKEMISIMNSSGGGVSTLNNKSKTALISQESRAAA